MDPSPRGFAELALGLRAIHPQLDRVSQRLPAAVSLWVPLPGVPVSRRANLPITDPFPRGWAELELGLRAIVPWPSRSSKGLPSADTVPWPCPECRSPAGPAFPIRIRTR